MLDIKYIRENSEKVKNAVEAKQLDPSVVDKVLVLDEKRRKFLSEIEELRAKRNKIAEGGKPSDSKVQKGKEVKEELKYKESELAKIEEEYFAQLSEVPNVFADDVPYGKDESENKIVRTWGEPKKFNFKPKDHLEIGEQLGIINVETASKVSGPRFGYLLGDAVLMEFALVQHAFNILTNEEVLKSIADKAEKGLSSKSFVPVVPPVMIKTDVFDKMARLKPTEERYYIPSDDVYMVGSAEHTLGPLHMDEILNEKDLPLRYVGFSTAFRREAGSYGKDTKGILRVHQFDKIEMETFTTSETSQKEQDFIVGIQEYLMQSLNIPYQVIAICTGDMGKPDFRQIDINSWLPGQDKYRETHTSDLMTDYQARRLNTRIRGSDGNVGYAHMNDATAFAIGRTIIAILENYQNEDGSVTIPEVLRKWVGKDRIVAKKYGENSRSQ